MQVDKRGQLRLAERLVFHQLVDVALVEAVVLRGGAPLRIPASFGVVGDLGRLELVLLVLRVRDPDCLGDVLDVKHR